MGEFSADADLQGGRHAGSRARRLIHRELGEYLSDDAFADADLLLTELVVNTVWHGGADERSTLHIRVWGDATAMRVEVENPENGSRDEPAQRPPDLDGGGGLGLHIVERLATRWGVRHTPRVAVWFELDWSDRPVL